MRKRRKAPQEDHLPFRNPWGVRGRERNSHQDWLGSVGAEGIPWLSWCGEVMAGFRGCGHWRWRESTTWGARWVWGFSHRKMKTAGVTASRGSGPERAGVGALEGLRRVWHARQQTLSRPVKSQQLAHKFIPLLTHSFVPSGRM